MPGDRRAEDSEAAVFRAIGRLEGQFSALETRVLNAETTNDKRLSSIVTKLEELKDAVTTLKMEDASDKGKVTGGWIIFSVLAAVASTITGLALTLWSVLHGK